MVTDENLEGNWANSANPPEMIMKLMLLQKKQGFIEAYMSAANHLAKGAMPDTGRVYKWLMGLFLECGAVLERDNKALFDELAGGFRDTRDLNKMLNNYNALMLWLDKKGLRWDVRGGYDKNKLSSVVGHLDNRIS